MKASGTKQELIMAAATGQAPYSKSNQFLEGFIRWQAAGNPWDWEKYVSQIFGKRNPDSKDMKGVLTSIGIEIVSFDVWPGFSQPDFADCEKYASLINKSYDAKQQIQTDADSDKNIDMDMYKKILPEAESLIIVKKEREGVYYIILSKGQKKSAWFISHTYRLNTVEEGLRITWQPEAFLNFASTLSPISGSDAANRAFEIILWNLAKSGISLISEDMIQRVFGGVIDQATLSIEGMRQEYDENLAQKYGESSENLIAKIEPSDRPLAIIQLANEIIEADVQRRKYAEKNAEDVTNKFKTVEKLLLKVERYRKKMEKKQQSRRKR